MLNCIVVGRVLPERATVRFGTISANFEGVNVKGTATAFAEFSQVSVHMTFDRDFENLHDIVGFAKSTVSPIANYIAFKISGAYDVVFDLIIDVAAKKHFSVSIVEPIFANEEDKSITFRLANYHDDVLVPISALDGAVSRVLEELSNALKRPHLSPMYCRLAIETIRSSFNNDDEAAGWEKLRETLNVTRDTISTFWKLAADQRHGRTIELNWDKRKNCLRIAWEITNRFIDFKQGKEQPEFPL